MAIIITEALKARGYEVSTLKSPEATTLAKNDVTLAYFPADETFEDEAAIDLLCALTYSLLLRRGIVATRYGATEKRSQYSDKANDEAITRQIRNICTHRLEAYTAIHENEINDIIRIYDNVFLV